MSSPERPQPELNQQALLDTALDCYLAAILSIADTVAGLCGDVGIASHDQLVRLRGRVAYHASIQTLEESRAGLQSELIDFAAKARQYHNLLTRDVAQALDLLAQSEMQGKLAEFQEKLREVELLASIDPLTAVPNRREFDRQLAARVAANREFCVLLFDLNTFKRINCDYGHLCGDEILKQLGARLSTHVRPRDFVCRWGGDEFVAILECQLPIAQARAEEIAALLSGEYQLVVDHQPVKVNVGVSVGVAERIPGETSEQLFHRADQAMYQQKRVSKPEPPVPSPQPPS